ncbi:efflux RND transporter periplasmic adaptor subunit [bacterium]|nr:efflux RND transporter periplasmic adaptor subunit [bacterium]
MKRMMMAMTTLVLTVLLGCGSNGSDGSSVKPVKVFLLSETLTEVPHRYVFSGNVEGDKKVTLSTKIMGQITALPYDVGTRVSAGQSVIKIKSDDLAAKRAQIKANKAEAEAALKNAETNFRRIQQLYDNKSASKKELDDIETMYTMATAKVNAITEMEKEIDDVLDYSDIVSPINGTIIQKFTEEGNTAAPGMPLLMIEDIGSLKVLTKVPESEIGLFKIGSAVTVAIDAIDREMNGVVEQINPSGNGMSRQFDVKIRLNGSTQDIKSGMYARVILASGSKHIIALPKNSLIHRGQLEGVYTLNHRSEAVLRWVRTGKTFGDHIEILSGLKDGERVIASSEGLLKDGMKVEVAQ